MLLDVEKRLRDCEKRLQDCEKRLQDCEKNLIPRFGSDKPLHVGWAEYRLKRPLSKRQRLLEGAVSTKALRKAKFDLKVALQECQEYRASVGAEM